MYGEEPLVNAHNVNSYTLCKGPNLIILLPPLYLYISLALMTAGGATS